MEKKVMKIEVPEMIPREFAGIANEILTKNIHKTEVFMDAYNSNEFNTLGVVIAGSFIGYIPKAWLIPPKEEIVFYVAQDNDGEVFAHEEKPKKEETSDNYWYETEKDDFRIGFLDGKLTSDKPYKITITLED